MQESPVSFVAAAATGKTPAPASPLRVKYHSGLKVLLCYLVCWGAAALLTFAALYWLFPYKLVGTSPNAPENLSRVFPFLRAPLSGLTAALRVDAQADVATISRAMLLRDLYWRQMVGLCVGVAMLLSLLVQLCWRASFTRARRASRAVSRAVRWYRLLMTLILLLNVGMAAFVYLIGVRFIADKTAWDYVVYFGGFALTLLASVLCFRLAAPPTLSGYRAFFKRL